MGTQANAEVPFFIPVSDARARNGVQEPGPAARDTKVDQRRAGAYGKGDGEMGVGQRLGVPAARERWGLSSPAEPVCGAAPRVTGCLSGQIPRREGGGGRRARRSHLGGGYGVTVGRGCYGKVRG